MTYTIGTLAKQFGLSRSTLLYYDKKGLLKPSTRTDNNYRVYNQLDYQRLQNIVAWREAGLSLEDIANMLEHRDSSQLNDLLQRQVQFLNEEIKKLRKQQRITLQLLKSEEALSNDAKSNHAKSENAETESRSMDKRQWVQLLAASGMSDDDMWRWHQEFERLMPQAHQDFLESLNIPAAEIKHIRQKSQPKNL